jgi:hypothetical protein
VEGISQLIAIQSSPKSISSSSSSSSSSFSSES